LLTYEKETGRVVKYLDRAPGSGSVWKGLRKAHFANGNIVAAEKVGTLVRCSRTHLGALPWFHQDNCGYSHKESENPLQRSAARGRSSDS
jgi:hypothetical protein